MNLTINDLKEYAAMDAVERHKERGRAIRTEAEERMRWMPIKWRRLIRCRFFLDYSPIRTAMEINVSRRTVERWTKELAAWLEDKDKYLEEQT